MPVASYEQSIFCLYLVPDNTIGSFYESHSAATAQERKHTRAHASLCALDRGDLGCCMSPVDVTRAMGGLLRMHESEFEMQVPLLFLAVNCAWLI